MMLTLNQVLWIILTVAAVVVMAFLAMFLNQLRKTAREAETTLVKARGAIDELQVIESKINASLDNVGQVLAVLMIIQWQALRGINRILHRDHDLVADPLLAEWEAAVESRDEARFPELLDRLERVHHLPSPRKLLWK